MHECVILKLHYMLQLVVIINWINTYRKVTT